MWVLFELKAFDIFPLKNSENIENAEYLSMIRSTDDDADAWDESFNKYDSNEKTIFLLEQFDSQILEFKSLLNYIKNG